MCLLEVLGLYGRCFVDTEDLALVAASQGGPRRSYSRAQQNERGVGQITNEERSDAGFRMTVQGQNLDEATFARMVGDAEKGCPVSRVLNAAITVDAKLT